MVICQVELKIELLGIKETYFLPLEYRDGFYTLVIIGVYIIVFILFFINYISLGKLSFLWRIYE